MREPKIERIRVRLFREGSVLKDLYENHWHPFMTWGVHRCFLCNVQTNSGYASEGKRYWEGNIRIEQAVRLLCSDCVEIVPEGKHV